MDTYFNLNRHLVVFKGKGHARRFACLLTICIFILLLTAKWGLAMSGSIPEKFRYDPSTGQCRDAKGLTGLNRISLDQLLETKDGECADLREVKLGRGGAHDKLDLRGANLSGASFSFGSLHEARLEGTFMKTFHVGYLTISGTVDRYTVLPEGKWKLKDYSEGLPRGSCLLSEQKYIVCGR